MLKKHKQALACLAVATLFAMGLGTGTALAREEAPSTQDRFALAEGEIKQLLLLMDQDKNGKISEQEFMKFMKVEFDRLDEDKSGGLDVQGLTQSQFGVTRFSAVGK